MFYIDPTGQYTGWSLRPQPTLGLTHSVESLPENEIEVALALGIIDPSITMDDGEKA